MTVLLPAALRRAWPELGSSRLRLVCQDDVATGLASLRSRTWQAMRGVLGLFRDVSEELLRLRRLRSLDAQVALAPSGAIAADLLPLRHVLLVPEPPFEPLGESLRRVRAVASAATRDNMQRCKEYEFRVNR